MGHAAHEPWIYGPDPHEAEQDAAAEAEAVAWQAAEATPDPWSAWKAAHPCEAAVIQATYLRLVQTRGTRHARAYLAAAQAARGCGAVPTR